MFQSYLRWIRYSSRSWFVIAELLYQFQSYLRWIRYSRFENITRKQKAFLVSILFEVDSVFEVVRCIFPLLPNIVSILFEVDSVFEKEEFISLILAIMFQSYLRWIRYSSWGIYNYLFAYRNVSILFEVDSVFEAISIANILLPVIYIVSLSLYFMFFMMSKNILIIVFLDFP